MPPRTIHLLTSRNSSAQRAHFAIFIPATATPNQGTLIQAVGAPMTGYILEFERNYNPATDSLERYTLFPLGEVDSAHIVDAEDGVKSSDASPRDEIERVAASIPTPGISENFLVPVNDVRLFFALGVFVFCSGWFHLTVTFRSAIRDARSGRWGLSGILLEKGISVLRRSRLFSRSGIRRLMGLGSSLRCDGGVRFSASLG